MSPHRTPLSTSFFASSPHHTIALLLSYQGHPYAGFALQQNTPKTIEENLFTALEKTKLINSRNDKHINYARCGRTDKGVSAIQQVVSLNVRITKEMPSYILNRVLPEDIRIIAHAVVPDHFNARWDCLFRRYKYFFTAANLDIPKMQAAVQKFIGTNSFLHLHKHDNARPPSETWDRRITKASIQKTQHLSQDPYYQMYFFEVAGFAFLWHQVRYMMGALTLIGQGKEEPDIIDTLLNTKEEVDGKWGQIPIDMAPEDGLVLVECGFEGVEWINDKQHLAKLHAHSLEQFRIHAARTQHLQEFLHQIDERVVDGHTFGALRTKESVSDMKGAHKNPRSMKGRHIPLLQRFRGGGPKVDFAHRQGTFKRKQEAYQERRRVREAPTNLEEDTVL